MFGQMRTRQVLANDSIPRTTLQRVPQALSPAIGFSTFTIQPTRGNPSRDHRSHLPDYYLLLHLRLFPPNSYEVHGHLLGPPAPQVLAAHPLALARHHSRLPLHVPGVLFHQSRIPDPLQQPRSARDASRQ